MSNSEELERLSALKEKGALTQEEFDSAKADLLRPKKKTSVIRMVATLGLGLFILWAAVSAWRQEGGTRPAVPPCDSAEAKTTLQKAFDQSQVARTLNLSAIEVTNSRETEYDKEKGIRNCTADLNLNNTAKPSVVFVIEKREGKNFVLTFQVLDEPEAKPTQPQVSTPPTIVQIPTQVQQEASPQSPPADSAAKKDAENSVEKSDVCKGLDLAITAQQHECLDHKFKIADDALNNRYKDLMAKLDDSQKAALRNSQRTWIKEKEAKCAKAGDEFKGGTLEAILFADCNVQMTEQRVAFLKTYRP